MHTKHILKNISWLGTASILVKPLWFVFITILCVNLLGAFNYGILTSTLSLAAIASLFTDLGTVRYTVREIAKKPALASQFFSNILLLRIALSVGAWFLAMGLGVLLGYRDSAFIALVFASIYALSLNVTNFNRSIFQAHERLKLEALFLIAEKVLVVSLGAACLLFTRTPEWTLAGMASGMLLITILNAAWISRRMAHFDIKKLDRAFVRQTIRYSLPLGAAGIFAILYYRTDAVMIEYMLGETPTGQYGVAFRLLDATVLLPTVIVAGLFARFSSCWHEKRWAEFQKLTLAGSGGLLLISAPVALICTFFAGPIVQFIAPDPAFGPAVQVLALIMWTFPMNSLYLLLSASLTAMNEQAFLAVASGAAFLLNFILNLYLIPREGITGAAFATVATALFLALALVFRYYQASKKMRQVSAA